MRFLMAEVKMEDDPTWRQWRPPRSTALGLAIVGNRPECRQDVVDSMLQLSGAEILLLRRDMESGDMEHASFLHLMCQGSTEPMLRTILDMLNEDVDGELFCSWFGRPEPRCGGKAHFSSLQVACIHANAPFIEYLVKVLEPSLLAESLFFFYYGSQASSDFWQASADLVERENFRREIEKYLKALKEEYFGRGGARGWANGGEAPGLQRDESTSSVQSLTVEQDAAASATCDDEDKMQRAVDALLDTRTREGCVLFDLLPVLCWQLGMPIHRTLFEGGGANRISTGLNAGADEFVPGRW